MIRVCELAKKMSTSSLEVLKQADALDIEAYSPLSQLDTADASRLQEVFQRSATNAGANACPLPRKKLDSARHDAGAVQAELAVLRLIAPVRWRWDEARGIEAPAKLAERRQGAQQPRRR